MVCATPHYLTFDSGQIRLWRRGRGPDLVVVGGLTLAAEALANRLAEANAGWRVTAIELPGIGGSTPLAEGGVEPLASTVEKAIALAGFGDFVLVVHQLAAGLLPRLQKALGPRIRAIVVGGGWAARWKETVGGDLDIAPRQDGAHLNVLWHHLRDRQLLQPDNPHMPAKDGDDISGADELSQTFVAAATRPQAYATLWRTCLEALPSTLPGDWVCVDTLSDVSAVLEGIVLPVSDVALPKTTALPGKAIWHETVQTRRGLVHLRRSGGEGTPLLVIPTGGGSSAQFEPVVTGLAEGRQVFSVDYFGNGLSEKLDRDVTIAMLADDMAALIEAMGFDRVDVWGSHTGSLVGLELAVRRPDLVRKAVLEGPVFIDPDFQSDLLDNYFPRIVPDKWGLHLQLVWHWRRDMFMYWPWYRVDRAVARDLGVPGAEDLHLYAVGILESGPTYDQAYRSAFKYDTASRLPLLKRPALICAGPNDMLVNGVEESEKLKVPGVRTTLTPTTVWWPAPEPEAAAATLALYDEYLREETSLKSEG